MAGTAHDTKALVIGALRAALADVQVVSTIPYADGAPPGPLVLVIATGGQGQHHRVLSTGQVTIDSFAPTMGGAMELAMRVDTTINSLTASHDYPVTRVTGNAPAESPDPTITAARATATYQITTRNT